MDEANMCDRAGLIYEGKLIACGTIKELNKKTPKGSLEELFFIVKEGVINETPIH
jgi:ABC-2 type transport system ATP-binding protein